MLPIYINDFPKTRGDAPFFEECFRVPAVYLRSAFWTVLAFWRNVK